VNSEIANLHAKLTADTSDAQRNLGDVRTRFINAGIAARDLGNELSGSISHFRAVGGSAQDFAQKLEHIRREALEAAEGVSKTSSEYARLQGIAARATAELNRNAAALNNVESETRELQNQQRKASTSTNLLGGALGNLAAGLGVGMIAKAGLDFAMMAEQAEKTGRALEGLSGGQGAESIALIEQRLNGAVSKMQAAEMASRLFGLGMAETAEEAARFAELGGTLGEAFGGSAASGVEQLSLAIANLSYERLDALGISSGVVRARVAELKEEGYALEEAFRMATLEQATITFDKLAAQGVTVGSSMDQIKAAANNLAVTIGTTLAPALDAGAGGMVVFIDALNSGIQGQWEAWNTGVATASEHANWLAGETLYAADSMGWIADALWNTNPAFAATVGWAATLADEQVNVQATATSIPPAMAAIEGSSYGAASGLHAAAAGARDFKEAIDALNNQRTGNYGTSAAASRLNTQYGMQEALGSRTATRMGADEYFMPTPDYEISIANRLNAAYEQMNDVRWTPGQGWVSTVPVRGGGGGGGGRGGGGSGPRAGGSAAGAAMAGEFAGGMVEGFRAQLATTDDAGIKAAVIQWITDQQNIQDIRDDLAKELGSTMGATAGQIDLALTDLFGLRASPIDTMVDSMAAAAEQNAAQLQEVGATVGRSIEEGLETRFNGIGDRIVGIVLERLAEAA
jgi:hypothetical protein